MEREFTNYEQSLALKELGFDGNYFGFYIMNGEVFRTHLIFKSDLKDGAVASPLIQQAFRFFREKYGLIHNVGYLESEGYCYEIAKLNPFDTLSYISYLNTYEEAEQACLDKLIEICKNL